MPVMPLVFVVACYLGIKQNTQVKSWLRWNSSFLPECSCCSLLSLITDILLFIMRICLAVQCKIPTPVWRQAQSSHIALPVPVQSTKMFHWTSLWGKGVDALFHTAMAKTWVCEWACLRWAAVALHHPAVCQADKPTVLTAIHPHIFPSSCWGVNSNIDCCEVSIKFTLKKNWFHMFHSLFMAETFFLART